MDREILRKREKEGCRHTYILHNITSLVSIVNITRNKSKANLLELTEYKYINCKLNALTTCNCMHCCQQFVRFIRLKK